jgi:Holliday junction resolvase RusA-like endonuclease
MTAQAPLPLHTSAQPRELVIRIPGEPVGQGRGRAFYKPGLGVRVYDPAKSRNWKATAQQHYIDAIARAGIRTPAFAEGALELEVLAVFTCARSHWRKIPVPRRPKTSKPDGSNVLKAVEDAGNGVLWLDDQQIAVATVRRVVGAQGEAPYVEVVVRELTNLGARPPGCPPPVE